MHTRTATLLPAAAIAALLAACTTTHQPPTPTNIAAANLPTHVGSSIDARLARLRDHQPFNAETITASIPDPSNAHRPIQAAIDALPAHGGTVALPAGTLIIDAPIRITRPDIRLVGQGRQRTTIRYRSGAMRGRIRDCIEIKGPSQTDRIANIHIADLTVDANYWNHPGSYNPRGIDSDNALNILVERVHITRAFVGLTFGKHVARATAHDVTITQWHNDAFNASGDGQTAAANNIVFHNCVAHSAFNERRDGPPGNRNNAWEIEDGAANVTLINCRVADCSGNGFAVRNHALNQPCTTGNVTFINCHANNVEDNAFHVIGNSYPNTIAEITLINCYSDSVASFTKGVRGLNITDSTFNATVSVGPARNATITDSTLKHLTVWAFPVTVEQRPSASYDTSLTITNTDINGQLSLFGEPHGLTLDSTPVPEDSNLPTNEQTRM